MNAFSAMDTFPVTNPLDIHQTIIYTRITIYTFVIIQSDTNY